MSSDICISTRLTLRGHFLTKTCSHCYELSEVLWRDLIESISNKTSLPVFPFLNTQKGRSIMQFPSTWCPLTETARVLLQVWALAFLQHQHYVREEWAAASISLSAVIDLSGHLLWLFIICSQLTSQLGGRCVWIKSLYYVTVWKAACQLVYTPMHQSPSAFSSLE